MKTGFYLDDEGILWLLSPGKKLAWYCPNGLVWKDWTGSYKNGLSWIVPEVAEYLENL